MNKEDRLLTIKSIIDHCDDIDQLISDLQKEVVQNAVFISMREHNGYVSNSAKYFQKRYEEEENEKSPKRKLTDISQIQRYN